MGGAGRQFAERGYTFPKPLVEVAGQPLIEIVVKNLTPSCEHQFVFVCRQEHLRSYAHERLHDQWRRRHDYNYQR